MALSKMAEYSFRHADQLDRPQESASTRKEQWDSRGSEARSFINALIDILNSPEGASNIAATSIASLEGETVQELLESLRNKLRGAGEGASGADFVKSSGINGLSGETVQELLLALKGYTESKVSKDKGAIASISGIDNARGNVDIRGGTGILISPDDESKEITITATLEAVPAKHAAEHALGGIDPITPLSIGAAPVGQLSSLAGDGRTTETVKDNADAIAGLVASVARGVDSFSGSGAETEIDHGLERVPTVAYVIPIEDPEGYLGEMWVRIDGDKIYVGNSGSFTGDFSWIAIL